MLDGLVPLCHQSIRHHIAHKLPIFSINAIINSYKSSKTCHGTDTVMVIDGLNLISSERWTVNDVAR